jgi:hypothetical protein
MESERERENSFSAYIRMPICPIKLLAIEEKGDRL